MWTLVVGGLFPAAGALRNYLHGNLVDGRAAWVGIFANPNDLAYSLVILLPLALFLATDLRPMQRLALMGIAMVYIAAIFVTFSRGGAVGLVAVIAFYAWRKKNVLLQGLVLLLLVAGVMLAGRFWTRGEDFSHLNGDNSFQQRWATSAAGLAMFADHPLLGVGLGCSVIAWPLYAPEDLYTRTALVTHNTFIEPLAETGIAGFLPFILFVGFGLYYARKLALESSHNGLANVGAGLEI
jgi:O-antigen ligase